MPDSSKVKVPLFSAANSGGQGLHPRGNFEGFVRAASRQSGWRATAWIAGRISTRTMASALQRKFFGHFLRGEKTGWDKQPKVLLQVRYVDKFVERHCQGMAAQADQVDQDVPQPSGLLAVDEATGEEIASDLQGVSATA